MMNTRTGVVLLTGLLVGAAFAADKPTPVEAGPDADGYLALARAYADAMIEKGRDRYGEKHSPLFAAALDLGTMSLPEKAPPNVGGLRGIERSWRGANPQHDQYLYQLLYALTKITGEKRYGEAADAALKWFFENAQSPETGLLAWGEHLQWDFRLERAVNAEMKNYWELHEFYRPWLFWERCFDLTPGPCLRFAKGLWAHQIADQTTGAFSRHAGYHTHKTETDWELPRHGGFYIATWARAYARTKDPEFLRAVTVLVDGFLAHRHPGTGALPPAFGAGAREHYWAPSNLSLAIDLWDAAPLLSEDLGKKMRDCARQIDEVYLKTAHDLGPAGKGFLEKGLSGTLLASAKPNWTRTWGALWSDARAALQCEVRYRQVEREQYRDLILAAAQRYVRNDPPSGTVLHPGTLADAMRLMRTAHAYTGQKAYLDRAWHFANLGHVLFLKGSSLPRASSDAAHYEAATGGDALMMEYLALWCKRKRPEMKDLSYCER
jgi:hypothetical protein